MNNVDASLDDMGDLSTNDADNSLDDDFNADEKDVPANLRGSTTVNTWSDLGGAVYNNNNYDTVYIGANLTPGGQIVINHDVTIIGSANTYIGGSSSSSPVSYSDIPIYSSASGLSITLKNIRFQNCGGNILMKFSGNGNYILDNCTFENVTATGNHQAVVHLNLGNCEIINCTFEKCTTSYGAVSNYNENSVTNVHMTVRETTFKNNHATVEPGCINNCGQLEVYDSIFEDNSATWWAGAIHTHTNANTTVVRSIFRNNIAGWNGGALYTYSHLTVIDSIFTGNEAHQTSGGAIAGSGYGSRPYLTVLNSEFRNNNASGSGGAISFGSGELVVNNSVFAENKALSGTGGAISTSGATSTITYSNFTNNSATGRGGAIYATGNGQLNVYHCNFVNNTGSEGQDIAYHYTTKKTNKAFLRYDYNEFWGANNASGSIYAYNRQYLNVTDGSHNGFHDISQYVTPSGQNSTNNTNGTIIVPNSFDGNQLWNASLSGALGGTPLVNGDLIYVPNGNSIYCLNITNGNLLWNVSSNFYYSPEWNNFHDLGLHNGVLIAPCDMDKLYFFNATTGSEIQPTSNIIQGSSLYAPLVVGNNIYISSEYGYGVNNESWIAVINYNNGVYSYVGSILDISGVSYGTPALISAPILWNNYLWVNTINGLIRYDLTTNTYSIVVSNTVGKPVVGGSVMYVLTTDNHIRGVDSTCSLVKNITVNESLGVGSTLAISNDNTTLYTVCADGSIYAAKTTDNSATFIKKINSVSSALTVGDDGLLYVGDDAGILWVLNIYKSFGSWGHDLVWAYNVSSPVFALPILNDNIVYIGTGNMFYALYYGSRYSIQLNDNKLGYTSELLGISDFNQILGKDIPSGDLKFGTFNTPNTIYYLDGIYNIVKFMNNMPLGLIVGADTNENPVNNIKIASRGKNRAIINITSTDATNSIINVYMGNNITFENITFTGTKQGDNYHNPLFLVTLSASEVTFKNCIFQDLISSTADQIISFSKNQNQPAPNNVNMENCQFINCSAKNILKISDVNSINITNCIFDNVVSTEGYPISFSSSNVNWKDNTLLNLNAKTIFQISGSNTKVFDDVSFNVLTKTLTANTNNDIVAELVDTNGNHIYASGLKFSINGQEVTPSFDKTTGLYTLSYLAPESGTVSIMGKCSNIKDFSDEERYLTVVASPELTINGTSSITYGDNVININATLKEDINGENVTFTILQGSNVINSTTAVVTNGFANATFNQKLNVGSYTLSVTYGGSDNYGSATSSKSLTVSKATPNFIITVNEVFTVKDNITVTVSVPEGCEGTMFVGIFRDWVSRVDGKYDIPVTSGNIFNVTFNPLAADDYLIEYSFESTSSNFNSFDYVNYQPSGELPKFKVVKNNPTLNITHSTPVLNENVTITVTMNKDINEDVNVTINNLDPVVKQVVNGSLVFNITNAPYGPQNITVSFAGNDKYNATKNNIYFFVDKFDVNLTISADAITYGEPLIVMVNANKDFNGEVFVKIGNITKPVDVVEGKGNATFYNLTADEYFINATFTEDETFYADSANTTVTVKGVEVPAAQALTTNVPANTKSPTFSIKLDKDATGTFTVNIDNGKIVKTAELKDGAASITVADLAAGDHTISVSYSGDGKYAPITQNTTLTIKEPVKPIPKVTKKATKIVAKKKTFKAKVKVKKYTITLKSGKTLLKKVKVTLKVKGKTYKATTNKKGKATFKIKNLKKKGTYKAVIKFKGNKNYKATSKKVKIKVKK